jgi:hypothetical protein
VHAATTADSRDDTTPRLRLHGGKVQGLTAVAECSESMQQQLLATTTPGPLSCAGVGERDKHSCACTQLWSAIAPITMALTTSVQPTRQIASAAAESTPKGKWVGCYAKLHISTRCCAPFDACSGHQVASTLCCTALCCCSCCYVTYSTASAVCSAYCCCAWP